MGLTVNGEWPDVPLTFRSDGGRILGPTTGIHALGLIRPGWNRSHFDVVCHR
jgi:hypothetical protein